MNKENRQQDLLRKAEEADEQAQKVKDPAGQETWRKIADLYRDLAKNA